MNTQPQPDDTRNVGDHAPEPSQVLGPQTLSPTEHLLFLKDQALDALDRGELTVAIRHLACAIADLARPRRLAVCDGRERERLVLQVVGDDGPEVLLCDTEGNHRAELTSAGIRWFDANGTARLALALGADGSPAVRLCSPDGAALATLAVAGIGTFYGDFAEDSNQSIAAGLVLESPDGAEVLALASSGDTAGDLGTATVSASADTLFSSIRACGIEDAADVEVVAGGGSHFRFRAKPDDGSPAEATGRPAGSRRSR